VPVPSIAGDAAVPPGPPAAWPAPGYHGVKSVHVDALSTPLVVAHRRRRHKSFQVVTTGAIPLRGAAAH